MSQHDTLTQALEQIAMAAEATVCNPAWIAKHARAALATPAQAQAPQAHALDRDTIIDLISPLSLNTADHDIDFAFRVLDAAQAKQAGEPVAWRWRNCVGDWVTGWLDYKPSQRACIEQQVTEAGGIIQYAYATTPPAPAQPVQGVPERAEIALRMLEDPTPDMLESFQRGFMQQLQRRKHYKKGWEISAEQAGIKSMLETVLASVDAASPPPPAQQPAGDVVRDAERYRFLAERCRSASEHWGGRWWIVIDGPAPKSHDSEDDFDAAIDAALASSARKAGGE